MHLQPPPGASPLVGIALTLVLSVHIGGGVGGVASGFAALLFPKGSRPHRQAGDVFVICLLVLSATGAATAPFLPVHPSQRAGTVLLGIVTGYLVATGWATARRSPGAGTGQVERAATLVPLVTSLAMFVLALMWTRDLKTYGQVQTIVTFVVAALMAACAMADVSVILRRVLSARQRLVRHLWRMCTGLLLATAGGLAQSGVVDLLPKALRTAPVIASPVIAILLLMSFWLARVGLSSAWKPPVTRRADPA